MRKTIGFLLGVCCALLLAGEAHALPTEYEGHLRRARELYELGRWSDARKEFVEARRLADPEDIEACLTVDYFLAMCRMELHEAEAAEGLEDFLVRHPESAYCNDVEFALGSLYCAKGDTERALAHFGRVNYSALGRRHREQYDIRMGYLRFGEGAYDEALRYFARIDPRGEFGDHALYYTAYIDYVRGNNAAASNAFKRLLVSPTYGALAPYYLLQIEFNEGNYQYVVNEGERLIENAEGSRRAELERVVAEAWFHLGDYNKSIAALNAYRGEGGRMGRNENYILGYGLYRTARYDEARGYLQQACGADDALTQNASYHLADCYLRAGNKQQAMQAFAMAANEDYDAAIAEDALFNYGKLQYELGGGVFNEAINVLGRYLARYPSSPRAGEARELLIAANYNSNNYDAAYEALKQVPDPDSNLRAALQKIAYFRGLQSYMRGELAPAAQYLRESAAVNVSPKYAALAQFWLGEIAYAKGDLAAAKQFYADYLRRAPKSEPQYAMASYGLGYCYFDEKQMSQAMTNFAQFNALWPSSDSHRADALNRLGDTYYAQRRFADALTAYERAAAVGSVERYYADYQRAIVLGILDRRSQKIEALETIIRADKGDYVDDATYELGRTYIAAGEYRPGAEVLTAFVEEYPHSPFHAQALSDLGLAYLNLGDEARSRTYYERVVAEAPNSSAAKDALQGIREIYVSSGNVEAYFDYAEQAGVECDTTRVARDSLSFAAARKIYLSGDRAAAEKSLSSYLKNYPKGFYLSDALFYLTDCRLQAGDKAGAIEALQQLAEQPTGQHSIRALDLLAGLTYEAGRYAEAAQAYRALYDVAQTNAELINKSTAATGYFRSVRAQGDDDATLRAADEIASMSEAGATARRESRYAKATILRGRGQQEEALMLYRALAEEVESKEGAEAAYRLIEATYAGGDAAAAEKEIFAFADRNSPQAYWVAKAYLLLGDIYAARGDNFQARATYQSIADGYSPADDGIVAEAEARIQKLK